MGRRFETRTRLREELAKQPPLDVDFTFSTVTKTADYTLSAADCNGFKTFTNTGASGTITFTLPSGVGGMRVLFAAHNNQQLNITPHSGEVIHFAAQASTYDDYPGEVVTSGEYHDTGKGRTNVYDSYVKINSGVNYQLSAMDLSFINGKWRMTNMYGAVELDYTAVPD